MVEDKNRHRVLCVFGTRPDAVKMAPVVLELLRHKESFDVRVLVTGQHREQLDQVLKVFQIVPDRDLAIMQHGQTLTQITTRSLEGINADLETHAADICLAQGDTTTTFVAALAAFYHQVPFGHIEAGLRTGNRYDPFPEEMNRRFAGVLATWHFAPTEPARNNLLAEGVDAASIHVTGNTSIDALRSVSTLYHIFQDPILRAIVEGDKRLILVTAHRRENWGEPMSHIASAIARLAKEFEDCEIVVAMHRNPIVRGTLLPLLSNLNRVHLIEPPDYVPFVKLMQRSFLILTDSGGVQEEAPTFGIPILVLRRTTERQEGVDAGTAKLIGTAADVILNESRKLLTDPVAYAQMARSVNPYGDGSASRRIAEVLKSSGGRA